jgi:hypothetical protein
MNMKKTTITIFTICLSALVFGQNSVPTTTNTANTEKPKESKVKVKMSETNDDLMISLTMDNLIAGGNGDSAYTSNIFNPNLGLHFLYDMPIGKTGFSFAPGIGLSFSKVNLDNTILMQDSSGTRFVKSRLHPDFKDGQLTYEGSSFYTSWLDIPVELRFRSKPINGRSSIKVAFGFKAGLRLGSNSKVSYIDNSQQKELTEIQKPFSDLNSFRYGATFRVGYGALNLIGYYGMNQLIKDSRNPANQDLRQYSIGIAITGL